MKTSKELHHYISVCANIQTPDKGSRLPSDALATHGCSMVCWRLDDQDGFADTAMWGKQDIVGGRVHGVSILQFPKMERLRVVSSPLFVLLIG
jgi:hypothetical protein